MKKFFKVVLIILLILIIGIASIAIYVKTALPNVGSAPVIKVDTTPMRLERGKYLANNVLLCLDCHTRHDYSFYGGPLIEAETGGGGEEFGKDRGFPGTVFSKNITPYALSNWTDGEILRAITTGVNKNGKALFPLMPYHAYGQMDQEDIYSIIAYLRTLTPVKNDVPDKSLDFPLNFIVNTIPAKASLSPRPDTANTVAYGKYLVTSSACAECHSRVDKGNVIPGTEFGGGREFPFPNGTVAVSVNITPDNETGIGTWSKDMFIQRFKQFSPAVYKPQKIGASDFNTTMPWLMYAGMKESDLGAIYAYLRTVQPIKYKVERFKKKG